VQGQTLSALTGRLDGSPFTGSRPTQAEAELSRVGHSGKACLSPVSVFSATTGRPPSQSKRAVAMGTGTARAR
jgi:hypothetical protein